MKFWKRQQEKRVENLYKTFVYLDDELTVDSLSAIEAGKIDEVVEKINSVKSDNRTRSRSMNFAPINQFSASLKNEKIIQDEATLQEEVVRRRTSASIFEQWFGLMQSRNALHRIEDWCDETVNGISPGDLLQLHGQINVWPYEIGMRTFIEVINRALKGDPLFDQVISSFEASQSDISKGIVPAVPLKQHQKESVKRRDSVNAQRRNEETKQLEEIRDSFLSMLGNGEIIRGLVDFSPSDRDDSTEKIGIRINGAWVKESLGAWSGKYTIVAQVDEVLAKGEYWQMIRVLSDMPITQFEEVALQNALPGIKDIMCETLGLDSSQDMMRVPGPLITLRPIAIYR